MRNLWEDDRLHHQFQLVERESGMVLEDSIEIHTVELTKYNSDCGALRGAGVLEQWAYWIKNASEHTVEELRELLPSLEFLRATGELNAIREITEEKQMYDAREKASLDIQSNLIDAKQEGENIGEQRGIEIGEQRGIEIGEQRGIEIGEQRGIEIGEQRGKLKGSVQIFEGLLGTSVSSDDILNGKSNEELASMVVQLQKRLRDRMS